MHEVAMNTGIWIDTHCFAHCDVHVCGIGRAACGGVCTRTVSSLERVGAPRWSHVWQCSGSEGWRGHVVAVDGHCDGRWQQGRGSRRRPSPTAEPTRRTHHGRHSNGMPCARSLARALTDCCLHGSCGSDGEGRHEHVASTCTHASRLTPHPRLGAAVHPVPSSRCRRHCGGCRDFRSTTSNALEVSVPSAPAEMQSSRIASE